MSATPATIRSAPPTSREADQLTCSNHNKLFTEHQRERPQGRLNGGGRLSIWVHKLEKINANLDENDQISGTNNKQSPAPTQETNQEELCFKVLSLATELVLIIFAACLLLIASVVIFSKKVPAFMESYEIVPMVLFVLCIALAVFSVVRYLSTKIDCPFYGRKRARGQSMKQHSAPDNQKKSSSPEAKRLQSSADIERPVTPSPRLIVIDTSTSDRISAEPSRISDRVGINSTNEKILMHQHARAQLS